jgi:uncharacterized protein YciI
MKQFFYIKLIPPRPTFAMDMNEHERGLMMQHVAYFGKLFAEKRVLIYGPVMAAEGSFGMGVLQVENADEVKAIMESDPTIVAGLNRYEIAPMRVGGAQAAEA